MNVLVCFKVVPMLEMLSDTDWEINGDYQVNTNFIKNMINTYDESALELALKLNDKAIKENIGISLDALTISNKNVDSVLKNLYALKYDKTINITCNKDIRFNPNLTSLIIQNYLEKIRKPEVIILGKETNEGNNEKTHYLLSERLGIPLINSVVDIAFSKDKTCLHIKSKIDDLLIDQTIKPPVILVIGNVANSYIRIPTLKNKMKYSKKDIEKYSLLDLGIEKDIIEDCVLVNLKKEEHHKDCIFISSDSPYNNAKILYKDYLKEKIKI